MIRKIKLSEEIRDQLEIRRKEGGGKPEERPLMKSPKPLLFILKIITSSSARIRLREEWREIKQIPLN